jgi:hypothetical protein
LSLLLFRFLGVAGIADLGSRQIYRLLQEVMVVLVAELAILAAGYGYFSLVSGLGNLWEQVVVFPITELRALRWKPYPTLFPQTIVIPNSLSALRLLYNHVMEWLQFYLVLAIYAIALAFHGYLLLSRRATFDSRYLQIITVTLFGPLLFIQALSRYDYFHVVPTSIIALLVVVSLPLPTHLYSLMTMRRLLLSVMLLALALFYISSPILSLVKTWREFSPLGCYSKLERADCIHVDQDQAAAVAYVQDSTGMEERIFVGNHRHDLIFVNDVIFYFLAGRASATKYHELYPGVATTLAVQEQIVQELESEQVTTVVLNQNREPTEPNASAISSHITYLDEFIRAKYETVAEFGDYTVWRRVR